MIFLGEFKCCLSQGFPPILALLAIDQLSHSYVLDSKFQVVHLRVEKHDFVILDLLSLKLVEGGGNLGVVHVQALMLLVVPLLLLELLHEHVLLVKEKFLPLTLD